MGALARGDHVTTGGPDDRQVGQVAADDGRHRLVKTAATGSRITLGDVRQPLERQRADLEVHPVLGATDRAARRCVGARRRRIVIAEESRLGLAIAQPAVLAGRVQPFQQTLCALEPAVRDRGISPKCPVVPSTETTRFAPPRPGPLARDTADTLLPAPRTPLRHRRATARRSEPLEHLGTACLSKRRFEGGVSLFPRASRERRTAPLHEQVWHQMESMTDGPVEVALPQAQGGNQRARGPL